MKIHDVYDFDAERAAEELLRVGFTAVDDFTRDRIDGAEDELFEALGSADDGLDVRVEEIETRRGPVFVFWHGSRSTLEAAREFVRAQREVGGEGAVISQRSLFPDAFEVEADALEALGQLEVEKGLECIAAARRRDPLLPNLDALETALSWLSETLGGRADEDAVADAFLSLPRAGLPAAAASFIDEALARFGLRRAGEFLDARERVHSAALRLVLGRTEEARRALRGRMARAGGEEPRADLWGLYAEACLGCERPEEANAAWVRALLLDPERVDLFRTRAAPLRDLEAELRAGHAEPEARALLFSHAWMRGSIDVVPQNGWLDAHLARLRAETRADPRSEPTRRWRRFALLLYEDRSQPGAVDIRLREEMQALDPELFQRTIAVLRERELRAEATR